MNKMYYEQRFIKNSKSNTEFQLFEEENRHTLSDILAENKKVVLLGNPGIGKSTELNLLFDNLWETREENLNFPFNINLKNFRTISKFEDLIPFDEWKELPAITFILDGLDEIAEIQDFVSELENFLKRNEDRNITLVISCRTNIYEKYLIKISGFKYFYLDGLSDKQINNILEKRISRELNYGELNKFRVYLENPFNLNLFCEYYNTEKSFPETQTESWNLFIENELKKLSKEKLVKREKIDLAHIKKCMEKVAFTNELMQQNYIIDNDLYELLGKEDKSTFEQISLIERLPDSDNYFFRHKNYQEFFSARLLAELDSSEIIFNLKINPDVNKTKPSLFNTITFLLNIIDDDKFTTIKNWLLENEPEILFLTEKEKLNAKTQHEIFKDYFNNIAVEKTFWFGRDRRFPVDKIAEFADIDFLITVIIEDKHFRSVISALDVLAFTDANSKDIEIKELLVGMVFSKDDYNEQVLRTFKAKDFHKNDSSILKKIAKHFENDFSSGIHHQIISMLADYENIDDYFDILINSLHRLYEITPKRTKDNTIRGTQWILEKLFVRIQNSENFLQILNVFFNNKFELKISDFHKKDFKEKLIDRTLYFVENENDFLYKVIDAFMRFNEMPIYRKDNVLIDLIKRSSKDINAFKYIINKHGLKDRNYFILCLFDSTECIDFLVAKYQRKELHIQNENDINFLRNIFFKNRNELGYYFEEVFQIAEYTFPDSLPTQREIDESRKKYTGFVQQNFEILFDREKLTKEVAAVFNEHQIDKMTWKTIHDIEWKWYEKENYHGIQNSVFKVISNSVRNKENKTINEVISHIQNDYFILFQIKDKIKDREDEGFSVKPKHIEYIKENCLKFSEEFNSHKVINVKEDGNLGLYNGYYILKMLYFFDKKYDIVYPQEFYLKTLQYCNIFGSVDENIEFIKNRINDDSQFNQKIIHNLNNELLDDSSLRDHIDYAIENKLKDSYQKIGESILKERYIYSQKDFLLRFTELLPKHKKITFLKECCNDINSYLCWKAIDVFIVKELDNGFILNVAQDYLSGESKNFTSEALNVLFYCNYENTLPIYLDLINKFSESERIDLRDDYRLTNISSFERLDHLEILERIFEIIYNENLKDAFDYHNSRNNFQALIINLSKTEKGFNEVQRILNQMKSRISNKGNKFFYINNFIDESKLSYYHSLSKVFTFKEAKEYLKHIENPVVMRDQINISGGNFHNSQIGGVKNSMNIYSNNEYVIKAEELIKEFEQIKTDTEDWKNIFMEGMKDLVALKESESPEKELESKTKLRKIHDFIIDIGKKTNDWKNLVFLPVEFHDKVPKLMELGKQLSKLIL